MMHESLRTVLFLTTVWCCRTNAESDAPKDITSFIEYKIRTAFSSGGTTAVKGVIFEELHKWKDLPINIGVTGNSGVGKSSFINAIRDLSAEDERAAKVGVIETTQTMSSYQHPNNKNLLFWDLPGVGTPNFPQANYLRAIQAEKFDYFIIMSADRFTENDFWLAKEMEKLSKAFYFVRSKISQDIENDKKSHPKTHDKRSVLEVIRANCNQNLKNIRSLKKPARIYLIDNYDVDNYDFSLLSTHLIEDAPDMKREAITMSLNVLSRELVLAKKDVLVSRIYKVAVASALAGAAPIPVLDIAVDALVLLEEAIFYRSQFGLDEDSLRNHAKLHKMSLDDFTKTVELESSMIEFSKTGIIMYLSKIGVTSAASYATTNILKYTLPVIGNIVSGTAAYTSATYCLNSILDMMAKDALKINDYRPRE